MPSISPAATSFTAGNTLRNSPRSSAGPRGSVRRRRKKSVSASPSGCFPANFVNSPANAATPANFSFPANFDDSPSASAPAEESAATASSRRSELAGDEKRRETKHSKARHNRDETPATSAGGREFPRLRRMAPQRAKSARSLSRRRFGGWREKLAGVEGVSSASAARSNSREKAWSVRRRISAGNLVTASKMAGIVSETPSSVSWRSWMKTAGRGREGIHWRERERISAGKRARREIAGRG